MLTCIQSNNLNCTELLKTRMGARASPWKPAYQTKILVQILLGEQIVNLIANIIFLIYHYTTLCHRQMTMLHVILCWKMDHLASH